MAIWAIVWHFLKTEVNLPSLLNELINMNLLIDEFCESWYAS